MLWWEGLEDAPSAAPPGPLPSDTDVVVVGSGYCGLAAATELAREGRSVVLVERDELGAGASTRNGGMVIPELKAGPRTLERRLGPLGMRLHTEVERAFDHVESLVAGDAPVIDCDYERTGQLYLTHGRQGVRHLEELAALTAAMPANANAAAKAGLRNADQHDRQ